MRAAYPAIDGDSAISIYDGPGLPLANGITRLANPPHVWAIDLPSESLVFVALPVLLLIFGFAVVVNRGSAIQRNAPRVSLIVSCIGLLLSLAATYAYVNIEGSLDIVRATRTVELGTLLSGAAYVCALFGSVLARATSGTPRR